MNEIFEEYFKNTPERGEVIKKERTRAVFLENINGIRTYIKKYIPKEKKENFLLNCGLRRDYATHYGNISRELEKLEIEHVKPKYISSKKIGLFKNISIVVTEDAGKPLKDLFNNLSEEKQLEYMRIYFYNYKKMFFNEVYTTDYNVHGVLLGDDGILRLIDFDRYVYKRKPNRIFSNLKGRKFRRSLMKGFYSHHMEFAMKIENTKVREYIESQVSEIVNLVGKFF
ncbi:MAG: hypothetical protein ACRC6B_00900 [Fusobacteriaceae bacterium]